MSHIYEGAAVRVRVVFDDPDTCEIVAVEEPVTLTVRPPGGAVDGSDDITTTMAAQTDGSYLGGFIGSTNGAWQIRAASSGLTPAVVEGRAVVKASPFM